MPLIYLLDQSLRTGDESAWPETAAVTIAPSLQLQSLARSCTVSTSEPAGFICVQHARRRDAKRSSQHKNNTIDGSGHP
jgi:hypothetical protein